MKSNKKTCVELALHVASIYHHMSLCCKLSIMHEPKWYEYEDALVSWQYYVMCDGNASRTVSELKTVHERLTAVRTALCVSCPDSNKTGMR